MESNAVKITTEVLEQKPTTKNDLAQERYQDLIDRFGDKEVAKTILEDRKKFKAWLGRIRWNVKRVDELARELEQIKSTIVTPQEPRWIPVSERLPTKEEYIANNGLFIVSDGNRTYAEYFDVYNSMKYFGEPTMNGFRVDRCITAWMPLPLRYELQESEG